jgi:carbamoyl-phosphate synthase large subunit
MVQVAVNIMLGRSLREQGYPGGLWKRQRLVAVKAPVFSMAKLIGVDTYLGPEMKSTGEVMGIDTDWPAALAKALLAADLMLPPTGAALLSLSDRTKPEAVPVIKALAAAGYRFYATHGTAAMIEAMGYPVTRVEKLTDGGHPNVVDVIRQGLVHAVINTAEGRITGTLRDGFHIRRAAAEMRIPCFTSIDTARAAAAALAGGGLRYHVLPLAEYLHGRLPSADERRDGATAHAATGARIAERRP